MNIVRRVVGVDLQVAGEAAVSESELARKLGKRAWHVWQVLERSRDRTGVTHITAAGIAKARGFTPIGKANVKPAMRRLEEAGLVERIGWKALSVPCGKRMVLRKVYLRRVLGARALALVGRERQVLVPSETAAWLASAAGWGGSRAGSGRRKESSVPYDPTPLDGFSSVPNPFSSVPYPPAFQVSPPIKSKYKHPGKSVTSRTRGLPSEDQAAGAAAGSLLDFESEEAGHVLGGSAPLRSPPMHSTPLKGVPPYPGFSVIEPASVPSPPKLTADLSEERKVQMLAAAFRGAIERQYGKRCHLLKKISRRAPSFSKLAKAAELLQVYDVAPAAWCIWAVRRWYLARTHSDGYVEGAPVPLPPVGVVFSTKSINERLGDEEKRYVVTDSALGGRLIFGKTHKTLLSRYGEMRSALIACQGRDRAGVVARFFPGTSYADMVDAAKTEAVEIQNRLEDRAMRGELIW